MTVPKLLCLQRVSAPARLDNCFVPMQRMGNRPVPEKKTGELFPMPMTTHIFEIGCLYHRFPKNNVSQPFLQYSGSLSDALICDSKNITNKQNTAKRMFVLFLWRDSSQDCLVSVKILTRVCCLFFSRTSSIPSALPGESEQE